MPFQRRFPLNFFNENYIAGKKTENIDQTEPDFALIIPEINFHKILHKKWYIGLHIAKLQLSPNLAMKYAL